MTEYCGLTAGSPGSRLRLFSAGAPRRRAGSPKLNLWNNALVNAFCGRHRLRWGMRWGHILTVDTRGQAIAWRDRTAVMEFRPWANHDPPGFVLRPAVDFLKG